METIDILIKVAFGTLIGVNILRALELILEIMWNRISAKQQIQQDRNYQFTKHFENPERELEDRSPYTYLLGQHKEDEIEVQKCIEVTEIEKQTKIKKDEKMF